MNTELIGITKVNLFKNPNTRFLATVASMLPVSFGNTPTAHTDGTTIILNEHYFTKLTKEERLFLLAHEAMHIIYYHSTRRKDRDPQLWNIAGDYIINQKLIQQGFQFIEGGLLDDKYNDTWTTEMVYDDLLLNQDKHKQKDNQNPLNGDVQDGEKEPVQLQQLEQQITNILSKATLQMDMTGQANSVPTDIRRMLERLNKPKINWKVLLRRFLFELDTADYSWNRPRKRLLQQGFYLPKIQAMNIGKLAFAIDTSGSIKEKDFNQFIAEIRAIFNQTKPKSIHLIQFDDKVQYSQQINNLKELMQVPFTGNGGTIINTAIKEFMTTDSKALFVITDGYFWDTPINPNKPVYWIIYNNPKFTAPYGKTIHIGNQHD